MTLWFGILMAGALVAQESVPKATFGGIVIAADEFDAGLRKIGM